MITLRALRTPPKFGEAMVAVVAVTVVLLGLALTSGQPRPLPAATTASDGLAVHISDVDLDFLWELYSHDLADLTVDDAASITTGHRVCAALNAGRPVGEIVATLGRDGWPEGQAGQFSAYAAAAYCPVFTSRGEQ